VWRKEVALGRLSTLTILLTLGAWVAATDGAPPDDPTPAAAVPSTRPEPPAPPAQYVKAAVGLYNRGDYAKAAQYFEAADYYRDRLTVEDQQTLDEYRSKMASAAAAAAAPTTAPTETTTPGDGSAAGAPVDQATAASAHQSAAMLVMQARQAMAQGRRDEGLRLAHQAENLGASFAAEEDSPAKVLADLGGVSAGGPAGSGNPREDKQKARWGLRQAREQIALGNLAKAEEYLNGVRALNVRYNLFGEDTPNKVADSLEKARAKAPATAASSGPKDKRQAMAKLREAREKLAARQVDQAESIAMEVGTWNLRYGLMSDSPGKVLAAARALRRRDASRRNGAGDLASDIYGAQVQEARQLLSQGKLDEAEARARQAQGLNVAPPLAGDRAEAVLHDIAMRRGQDGAAPASNDPPSVVAERQANDLLQNGDREGYRMKEIEAERLAAQERGMAPAAGDAALLRTDGQAGPDGQPAPSRVTVPGAEAPAATDPAQPPPINPTADASAPGPILAPGPDPAQPAATGNPGEQLLNQARELMGAGNLIEAKKHAEQARGGNYGVDAQANELLAQLALAEQSGAIKLYEAAIADVRKGESDHARELLGEIMAMDIQDDVMRQKVEDLLSRLPVSKPGKATLNVAEDVEMVKTQRATAEVGTKVAESRRLMETDPDKAIAMLQQTLDAVKAAGLNEPATRMMTRRVEVALELAKKDKVAFDRKMQDKAGREEIETKRLRILEADKAKKAQVAELMKKATEADAAGNYEVAESLARRVVEIDPNELSAIALSTVARTKRHFERDKKNRLAKEEAYLGEMQDVDETAIIDTEASRKGIRMPKNFAELTSHRRDIANRLARKRDPKDQGVYNKLREPVTLNFDKQPLGDALTFISQYTGLNVVPDMTAFAEEGITSNTPVSLVVKDMKLEAALKYILHPLHLTYTVEEGCLLITSPQANRSKTYPVAYPVADLVISPLARSHQSPTPFAQTPPDPKAINDPAAAQNADGTAKGGVGNGATTQTTDGVTATVEGPKPDFAPLVALIKNSIRPGTWKDGPDDESMGGSYGLGAGGGAGDGQDVAVGSITPFFLNISLIIRHTAEVHDEVVDLLRQLRRLQDLQVSIEVRFITVNDSFFEQIGVNFEFNIRSDVVGKHSSFAIPTPGLFTTANVGNVGGNVGGGGAGGGGVGGGGVGGAGGGGVGGGGATGNTSTIAPVLINPFRDHTTPGSGPLVVGNGAPGGIGNFTPDLGLPFNQGSAGAITPFNATPNVGGTFGIAFLSDLEVYLFLTAAQGDQRSNVVQAPKVTTFNGAAASFFNNTQRFFVQSLFPIVGAGAVAFQPQISSIPDGVTLFVTPVVSADRRYVRMTLAPFFITFIQFQTFVIPAAVGGGGLGGQATSINAQLQLPVFSITNVNTTVTVPDGGTVLLGGVKRLREQRDEFGVPILAKTPIINRLFRNIGIGRTTDSLMLMVTPRIIILEEEEERLGIPPVQNATF
jgi:type II secretory pathway component GspD/PulD (secretin)